MQRAKNPVTVIVGLSSLTEVRQLALRAVAKVPGLLSAEFSTSTGLDILTAHAGLRPLLPAPAAAYLLPEAAGCAALDDLGKLIDDLPAAVGESEADRPRLWQYRERQPEAARFLGEPIKLDLSVPSEQWLVLAAAAPRVVREVDPAAHPSSGWAIPTGAPHPMSGL